MKASSYVVLTAIAAAAAQPASACDLCALYAASQAEGSIGRGFFAGVAEQFTHFGTLQQDGHEVPNTINQHIDSSVSQVFAGYNFNDKFGVQLNLPVIYRSWVRPRGAVIDSSSESGIGDLSLIGSYQIYHEMSIHSSILLRFIGGLKFPTGDSSRLGEPDVESENGLPPSGIAGHDLALGSRSVDGILGTSMSIRHKRLIFDAGLQYALRTEGDFGHQYANDLTWWAGPGYYVALSEDFTFSAQALFSGETKGKDTFNGVPDEDSAETIYYVGPQLALTWHSKLSFQVGADFPISIWNSGLQVVPDYRVRAAFTWRF
jgi:hypothetical protein